MNESVQPPILLSEAFASHSDLQRLQLFPGRHLGEQEFERMQAYTDRRIAPLLTARNPGIIEGLQVRTGAVDAVSEGLTVSAGLALAGNGQVLGLFYPLRQAWSTLIEEYLRETRASSAGGIFYLTLRRQTRYIDTDPEIDPCQRAEFDPTRDARRVLVGSLSLTRLALDDAAIASASREEIENWVAANNVERELLHDMSNAVPLGLLAIVNAGSATEPDYQPSWFSQAAGRYLASADAGYRVLLAQVQDAFRRKLLEAAAAQGEGTDISDYLRDNLRLGFLPAAGELPRELIRNIASASPSVTWLPEHLYIDMVAVPEESALELVARHLPRRAIDLRQSTGDRIRLLVAVNEPDYSPQLMQFPQTDSYLHDDIYRYSMRSHKLWQQWMEVFNRLYFVTDADVLTAAQLASLDLPAPADAPLQPQQFFREVIAEAQTELSADPQAAAQARVPYPYSQGVPAAPQFYRDWAVADDTDGWRPPPLIPPTSDGLVIRHTVARHELEAIDNQIRATRARLEKTRDYLLLQRQQLDNQTVSLAALAGGVAGDGSGLQVARWLPFTQLKAATNISGDDGAGNGSTVDTGADTGTVPTVDTSRFRLASQNVALNNIKLANTTIQARELAQQTSKVSQPSIFATTLRKSPNILSNVQLSLNRTILDKIAETPKMALTRPAFEAKEFRFGVLSHLRPEVQEYKKAVRGMRELITTLQDLFDPTEAGSIRKTLEKFGVPKPLEELGVPASGAVDDQLTARIYEAMFDAGRILTKQIANVEGRYARIEASLEGILRARIQKEAVIEKLAALIDRSTEELTNIDRRRLEYLGDYGVAQRLLDEDWLHTFRKTRERKRILTSGVKALYYVRERQTPISMPLADPLALRYGSSEDVVPGCDWETNPELPEQLEEFFDTVLEVSMADWTALNKLNSYLPARHKLELIANLRATRLSEKQRRAQQVKTSRRAFDVSLLQVRSQGLSLLNQLSAYRLPLAVTSLSRQQRESAQVMSLADLLSSSRGLLRSQAQTLANRLEQAIYCMLEKLNDLSPSVRLQWAQLAEDDRINVERVELWPGLDRAERNDFNATRTLAELVAWWFRQIDSQASRAGRSALRNMLRATLIHAALGDPAEILQGQVQVPPRRLAAGEVMRLKLNRPARPGTVLQLLDPGQRVIALLNVEDDDENGSVARVSRVNNVSATITTQYRVVSHKLTSALL